MISKTSIEFMIRISTKNRPYVTIHIETNKFAVPLYFVCKHTPSLSNHSHLRLRLPFCNGNSRFRLLILTSTSPKDLRGELGVLMYCLTPTDSSLKHCVLLILLVKGFIYSQCVNSIQNIFFCQVV